MEERLVKVGITHGDINGIGYEVILKTLSDTRIAELCQPTGGYGTATIIATAAGGAEARFTINVVTAPATPEPTEGAEN